VQSQSHTATTGVGCAELEMGGPLTIICFRNGKGVGKIFTMKVPMTLTRSEMLTSSMLGWI